MGEPLPSICCGPDCDRPAQRGALCWGHRKQKAQGRALTPLRRRDRVRFDVVLEAALAYADADSEEAFRRAKRRIRKAVNRYLDAVEAGVELPLDDGDTDP